MMRMICAQVRDSLRKERLLRLHEHRVSTLVGSRKRGWIGVTHMHDLVLRELRNPVFIGGIKISNPT